MCVTPGCECALRQVPPLTLPSPPRGGEEIPVRVAPVVTDSVAERPGRALRRVVKLDPAGDEAVAQAIRQLPGAFRPQLGPQHDQRLDERRQLLLRVAQADR